MLVVSCYCYIHSEYTAAGNAMYPAACYVLWMVTAVSHYWCSVLMDTPCCNGSATDRSVDVLGPAAHPTGVTLHAMDTHTTGPPPILHLLLLSSHAMYSML